MNEKELQESRKLFGQALAQAFAEKYDEELKEAPCFSCGVYHFARKQCPKLYRAFSAG